MKVSCLNLRLPAEQGVYLYVNSLTQAKCTKNKAFTTIPLCVQKLRCKFIPAVNLLVETYCTILGSILYCQLQPDLRPGTSISKDWRGSTYVFSFWRASEPLFPNRSYPWGIIGHRLLIKLCIVCVYLCPIRTLSLLRVFKITLQIYFVQGMKAIMANKPSYSGILVSLSIGGTSTRVIGVNPS